MAMKGLVVTAEGVSGVRHRLFGRAGLAIDASLFTSAHGRLSTTFALYPYGLNAPGLSQTFMWLRCKRVKQKSQCIKIIHLR